MSVADATWTIDQVIAQRAVRTLFQPVMHLPSGDVVGFEALSRGPVGSHLESPGALLAAAASDGRVADLDRLFRTFALRASRRADTGNLVWFVKNEPAGLVASSAADIHDRIARAGAQVRCVLEIAGRHLGEHVLDVLCARARWQQYGFGLAFDTGGVDAYAASVLPILRPDVIKLDVALVTPGHGTADSRAATAMIRAYARRQHTVVIASGIENEEQERVARVAGVNYVQGYRYGRPASDAHRILHPQRTMPVRDATANTPAAFDALAALQVPQTGSGSAVLRVDQLLREQAAAEPMSSVLLAAVHGERYGMHRGRRVELTSAHHAAVEFGGAGCEHREDWIVIVTKPNFAGVLVARQKDVDSYDYFYTFDERFVSLAAQSLLADS